MKRCTECGKTGATERHVDCADVVHWFHAACWRRLCDWLGCRGRWASEHPDLGRRK